jgi:hypothetical protein
VAAIAVRVVVVAGPPDGADNIVAGLPAAIFETGADRFDPAKRFVTQHQEICPGGSRAEIPIDNFQVGAANAGFQHPDKQLAGHHWRFLDFLHKGAIFLPRSDGDCFHGSNKFLSLVFTSLFLCLRKTFLVCGARAFFSLAYRNNFALRFLFVETRFFKILGGTKFYAIAYNLKRAERKSYCRLLFQEFFGSYTAFFEFFGIGFT